MVLRESLEGGVLRLTLDRPDKRNALSPDLLRALRAAFARARDDDAVRSVLLTGEGPAFCAGGDFDAMRARHDAPEGPALATKRAQDELFGGLAKDILLLEKPVVAYVNGDAFGAGLMLALACDHAVAASGARFAATFTKIGLIPDTAGTWLLPKTLGLRDARRLVLLPEPVDAREAADMGLVSEVGDMARAEEVARRWAEGPTRALGLAKRAIVLGTADDLDAALAREAAVQGLLFTTKDHEEGVAAFAQKRAPKFEGR
ncbi:MAG TPA: enoyl-CoA hydratase-related protein [Candidatus Thermoplasmatota archaeon]|nr:enoyl-CoA hydratase-related protein [Candidatus Thermoplasmatota archaeon]